MKNLLKILIPVFVAMVLVAAFVIGVFILATQGADAQTPAPASMDPLPNRITFYGGCGPDGLTYDRTKDGLTEVTPFVGPLIGIGYSRTVYDQWSVSALGLTGASTATRTFVLVGGIGYDF